MKKIFHLLLVFYSLIIIGCSNHSASYSPAYEQLNQLTPHYVPIKYGKIEYYQVGHGTPIVLIPGFATDITSWDKNFLLALAQHHRLFILNNRNVGGSIVNSFSYKSQDLAEDTYQLIHKLNLKKPAVLGISMGGMIAQQVAVLHAADIGQLILINTAIAGKKSVHPDPSVEKNLLNMPYNKLGRYLIAVKLFFPPTSRTQMAGALIVNRFQPKEYIEITPKTIVPQQKILIFDWAKDENTASKISELQLPTFILNGQADIVIPPVNSVILMKTIPHAELARWKNGGHAMIYQFPNQLADVINHFIARSS